MAKSIIDLFNDSAKSLAPVTGLDETPYSIGTDKTGTKEIDDKAISALETKLGSRYGQGMGDFGGTYSDAKTYSSQVKKD